MSLNMNYDTLRLMGKLALGMVAILLIVYLVAVATPWLAKKVDAKRNKPARVNDKYNFEKDNLKDIYSVNNNDEAKEVKKDGKE